MIILRTFNKYNNHMINIYDYFTAWALLISFAIFIWSCILNVSTWLFLFACCLLTTSSIIGTFFICIPNSSNIMEDALIHSGPLILFLCAFPFLKKYVKGSKHLGKTLVLAFILGLSYLGYVKFETVYPDYDNFCLVVLSLTVFLSSYQIYLNLLGLKV